MAGLDWDQYFIDIAEVVRQKSKDPSSKIGAVIVGADRQVLSTGYNGFPRGISELDDKRWERPIKYQYVEHAERNAIYNAARSGVCLKGATLYLSGFGPPSVPCTECAKAVIQSGIVRVVGYAHKPIADGWEDSLNFSMRLLKEAGIEFLEFGEKKPELEVCNFNEAWIGRCKNNRPCFKHMDYVCQTCGAPAEYNCDATIGAFVCGARFCNKHGHLH